MNSIIGLTEELQYRPELSCEYAPLILECGRNLQILMNDLLDLARIDSSELAIRVTNFSIYVICEAAMNVVSNSAASKGLKLELHMEKGFPEQLLGDPERFKQVIANYLSNAIKFTDEGTISVLVSQTIVSLDVREISVSVKDTGIGVSFGESENLFKEYWQNQESYKRGGVGLGLALVKKLSLLMGGSVGYQPNTPKGSIFWVRIPFRVPAASQKELPTQEDKGEVKYPLDVLVVEDSALARKVLCCHLRFFGCTRIDTADNGEVAVRMAQEYTYRLIFMDVQMPVRDGLQATREIRENGFVGPIWALTASAEPQQVRDCLSAGMDRCLTKPLFRATLKLAFEEAFPNPVEQKE